MRRLSLIFLCSLGLASCAPQGPAPIWHDAALDALFAELERADAPSAAGIEAQIWSRWSDSGSPTVNILLERANAAETAGDSEQALRFLDQAGELAPEFAEVWNRRANLAYNSEDYAGAVAAIQETLKRQPRHFAALAALGLIYEELGQEKAALDAFRAALAVHPHYQAALQGVERLEPRVDGREA